MHLNGLIQKQGYPKKEYRLVLLPHEELRQRIMNIKKQFSKDYQSHSALWGGPYITLATFWQLERAEEHILRNLKVLSMGFPPFKVALKDFGSFPTHTIYFHVETKIPIKRLVHQIRSLNKLLLPDRDHPPYFRETPYIPVATKLLPWQYQQGWNHFSHRHFTGSFIASSMLLLCRKRSERNFQVLERFDFLNLPVAARQGQLFD
ncbi:MAG: 2'-5' RNA ligase family protein [Bacteroidota bacterium]|nr:2'-5' RNA ligase family protein [Bacteroidota bacterium]